MSRTDVTSGYIDSYVKKLTYSGKNPVQVCNLRIHEDKRLIKNDSIFTMVEMNGQRQSFLSPVSGTVTKLYVHELDILFYDSIILEYEECQHTITFKNLCSDCGIDLNQLKNTVSTCRKAVISMEPSFPKVKITAEEALRYDNEDLNFLLRKRKLHLLIDLDQTLVHTTNSKNYSPSSSDIITYQLNTPMSQTFYTKLRSGVKEFLTNLRPLYQFHIVTFGERPYVNTIVKLIDPNGIFFSHRILSRDQCLNLTDKTANLSTLFPYSDALVCIIDDRDDVWNYASNLVQVKPYTWFKDVGDINSLRLSSLSISQTQIETNEEIYQSGGKHKIKKTSDRLSKRLKEHNDSDEVVDSDLYLQQLESILKRIHKKFYTAYDQWVQHNKGIMPTLKEIMPNIRRQILNSVSLCFTDLMPTNYPFEKHRATKIAKMMGAIVTHDLQFDENGTIRTTHLIAGKQTMKVQRALENNVKVVTPEWLIDCYEQWENKPEENYILLPDYDVRKSKLFTEEIPRVSKRRYCEIQNEVSISLPSSSDEKIIFNQEPSQTNCSNLSRKNPSECSSNQDNFDIQENDNDDTRSRPLKRHRTVTLAHTVEKKTDGNDEDFDSDSSSIQEWHDLFFVSDNDISSDEEGLSDDEVPRGWNEVYRKKNKWS
ncbi:unnamed protein product [Rotaria sp. Silwood1]|nr:unnamed protein product [Rotaria sp. Silwood1]CAF1614861.1 unnamed protein product [Rotaria sp. Silwood1]CAF3691727.1 unnamed protein product [Rotaria sp. Silwood1]CAF3818086.1 unnamed protein product [Rotaria sp. Silwood1]CAF4997137.1 unnamed protein product [Rotaria sp. Silwood1]